MTGASLRSGVQPWTREQIEAWVRGKKGSLGDRAKGMAARAVIVREFPEAPDYNDLRRRLIEFRFIRIDWPADVDEARALEIQRCRDFREYCASLSEPVEGEAP